MPAIFIAEFSLKMANSLRGKPLNSIELTTIADFIIATGCHQLVPEFNKCAERINWGALPTFMPGTKPPVMSLDVFKKYRSIITWTSKKLAA